MVEEARRRRLETTGRWVRALAVVTRLTVSRLTVVEEARRRRLETTGVVGGGKAQLQRQVRRVAAAVSRLTVVEEARQRRLETTGP